MNILLINYEYPPIGAGAANITWYTARSLVELGCKVVVLSSGFGALHGRRSEGGVTVYRCPTFRRFRVGSNILEMSSFVTSASLFLPGILKRHKIQGVIVYFSIPCGPLGLMGKLLYRAPYVISLMGGDVPGSETTLSRWYNALQPLRREVFRNSLAIVANSHGLKQLSEKADPFPVQVIPNGVDTSFFRPKPHDTKIFRFLFVGRFHAQKNLFFLLDQMKKLKEATDAPFELHLVGDGPQRSRLISHARSLNLDDRVHWSNWCDKDELLLHYQHADCMLNPSLYEGLPNTILEAMACGLPVIASRVIGNDVLVRDEETGFLFDLREPEGFQRASLRLMSDPMLGSRFGTKSRARVEQEFSWVRVTEEYLQLFKRPVDQ